MPVGPHDYQDQPGIAEILRVVREYLDKIVERVPIEDRYHAMCCQYLMTVAEREIAAESRDSDDFKARLDAFLGQTMPVSDAIRELANRIRTGQCDSTWDDTFSLVLDQVISKVRVSKPEHLDPMHRE
jgi:Domain of unknown function (DUF6285)